MNMKRWEWNRNNVTSKVDYDIIRAYLCRRNQVL